MQLIDLPSLAETISKKTGLKDNFHYLFVVDVDECAMNTCMNGASCVDGVATFTCSCIVGFTGANCETSTFKIYNFLIKLVIFNLKIHLNCGGKVQFPTKKGCKSNLPNAIR